MPLAAAALSSFLLVTVSPPAVSLHDSIAAIRFQPVWQPTETVRAPDQLAYHAHVDVPVTVVAVAAWIVAEVDKSHLAPVTCNWCDRAPDGTDTLNGFDSWGRRALLWHNTGRATTASGITAFILAPAAAYGLDWMAASRDGRPSDAAVDAVLISQAMAVASDVTEVLKFTLGRERPFVHVLPPSAKATTPQPADNNTSFPSGHTTLAFALATSSAEVARLRGYRTAAWVLRAGLPIATLTAYFRVAGDRHYLTDVIAGAAIGSGVGFGLPYLAHRKKPDRRIPAVRVIPTRGGDLVVAQWVW